VLFSFDDGFRSSWLAARQVLQPRGIRALYFVTVDFIDAGGRNWRAWAADRIFLGRVPAADLGSDYAPMTWDNLANLVAAGHTVGSHSLTHQSLAALDAESLSREIAESGDRLERRLGVRVSDFAFPFGNLDSISSEALRIVGRRYRYCYSGLRGGNGHRQPRLAILREAATPDDSPAYLSLMLEGGLDWRRLMRTRRLCSIAVTYG
jgi:peptidoglycan/xylan/chitin deacetylase (PgdA/CDA1 family)